MEETKKINQSATCWAFNGKDCRILTELLCSTKHCNFYKTKKQFEADFKKYERTYPY